MDDNTLFNEKRYGDIVKKYSSCEDKLNVEQLHILGKSYYKLKEYKKCAYIYKRYLDKNPEKDLLSNINLWCYYNVGIKNSKINEESLLKYANYIISRCKQEDEFSPYVRTIFGVIKYYENATVNPNYEKVYKWTGYLNPDSLSDKEKTTTIEGKETKVASDQENWYSKRSKACLELEKYQECIEICKKALKVLDPFSEFTKRLKIEGINKDKFHNHSDIWFKYRMGKSEEMLGNLEEAKKIFSEIIIKHKNFAHRAELARICEKLNEADLAKRYYYEAMLSEGTIAGKINIIEKIGDILLEEKDLENAKLNYILVKDIRENEKWKISQSLSDKISKLDEIESNVSGKQLYFRCKSLWERKVSEFLQEGKGVIKNLLNDGRSGFIKSESMELYFNIKNILNKKDNQLVGKEVTFNIIEGYDKKKQKKSFEAINIRL